MHAQCRRERLRHGTRGSGHVELLVEAKCEKKAMCWLRVEG